MLKIGMGYPRGFSPGLVVVLACRCRGDALPLCGAQLASAWVIGSRRKLFRKNIGPLQHFILFSRFAAEASKGPAKAAALCEKTA